jgi:pyridoxamine 5'-phosphate oxidase
VWVVILGVWPIPRPFANLETRLIPSSLQDPLEIRAQIWKELTRCVNDKHHAWRTPVLSTQALGGGVNARTVVLRGAQQREQQLFMYTDARSSKVIELTHHSTAMLVFWSPRLRWQLRATVHTELLASGPLFEAAWHKMSQTRARADYTSACVPGSHLVEGAPDTPETDDSQHHFLILVAQVKAMDWLELSSSGHRRAAIGLDTWEWLAP